MRRTTTRDQAWKQLGLIKRSEKIDTPHMLLLADAMERLHIHAGYSLEQCAEIFNVPVQGGVSPATRLREAQRVVEYWTDDLLTTALLFNAPWHGLTEPPQWETPTREYPEPTSRLDVFDMVDQYIESTGKWPDIGLVRRSFGRRDNHPLPGDQEGQDSLFIGQVPLGDAEATTTTEGKR
jgi:hypothetical protein